MISSVLLAATLSGFPQTSSLMCKITDEEINESSGLAVSRLSSGVFYTHNDSGDFARFFRFNKQGEVTGVFSLKNVKAIDWEDMCSTKIGNKSYLYLADVGDNAQQRKEVFVHRVPELQTEGNHVYTSIETFTLTYPDKARDCEAIFVHPKTTDLYLVSKDRDQETVVYVARKPSSSTSIKLIKLGRIEVQTGGLGGHMVTAGDISPNGRKIVLRTYTGALEFDVPARNPDKWIDSKPKSLKMPTERQGEAICYSGDGKWLITSSEGSPCPVSLVKP